MLATTDPGGAPRAVLFRIEDDGSRLYVFPYAPGTTNNPWLMDAYSSKDGACSLDPDYVRASTRRATLVESKEMSAWLDAQDVRHRELLRIPSTAYEARERALKVRP
jgi:hypothetical protein